MAAFARSTIDDADLAKYDRLGEEWWDENGPMSALHKFNPVRVGWIRDMLGRSAARIADNEEPAPLTAPRGPQRLDQPLTFARIHHYLAMATPLLWTRQADTIGVLGLALNTCAERDGYVEERERIAELLDTARDLWRTLPEAKDEAEARGLTRATFRLIHIADILTLTVGAD